MSDLRRGYLKVQETAFCHTAGVPLNRCQPCFTSRQACLFSHIFCCWNEMAWSHNNNKSSKKVNKLDWNGKCDYETTHCHVDVCEKSWCSRDNLIMSPAQPIGEVEEYFYHVEFQARGSPHIYLYGSTMHLKHVCVQIHTNQSMEWLSSSAHSWCAENKCEWTRWDEADCAGIF